MHLDSFIVSALLLLAVTSVAVALFRHLGLGSVLGLLVAGVVVGPHSPGPYVTAHVEDVRHFTELGVVLLLFMIGLEMKPSRLWSLRRDLFGLGSLQILLAGLAITLYVSLGVESWKTALLIGLTLALSSTAFVMQLLQERGEFASSHGKGAFAVLLMQDLSVVPLLAVVPLLSDTAAIASGIPLWEQLLILGGMFAVLWVFGLRLVPSALEWLARHDNREAFLLQASGVPFVSFDTDPERVAQGRAHGQPVLYGDISDPELLAAAHAERASLVVLTIEHGADALRAVSHLRNTYPRVPVIARARDLEVCARLLEAGATQAFPEAIEASLRLGAEALQMVGSPADSVELLMQGVRNRGYELVRERVEDDESP